MTCCKIHQLPLRCLVDPTPVFNGSGPEASAPKHGCQTSRSLLLGPLRKLATVEEIAKTIWWCPVQRLRLAFIRKMDSATAMGIFLHDGSRGISAEFLLWLIPGWPKECVQITTSCALFSRFGPVLQRGMPYFTLQNSSPMPSLGSCTGSASVPVSPSKPVGPFRPAHLRRHAELQETGLSSRRCATAKRVYPASNN